jgi:hypothetical protein
LVRITRTRGLRSYRFTKRTIYIIHPRRVKVKPSQNGSSMIYLRA